MVDRPREKDRVSHIEISPASPRELANILSNALCLHVLRSDRVCVRKSEVMAQLEQKASGSGYITIFDLDRIMEWRAVQEEKERPVVADSRRRSGGVVVVEKEEEDEEKDEDGDEESEEEDDVRIEEEDEESEGEEKKDTKHKSKKRRIEEVVEETACQSLQDDEAA